MVQQTDFDADHNMLMAIRYTFEGDRIATRTCLGPTGALELYRTYAYDDEGQLAELRFYNYNKDAGEEIEVRELYRYYTVDDKLMYEATRYTYDYAAKAIGRSVAGSGTSSIRGPRESHHGEN
jgi:hypothetical protein